MVPIALVAWALALWSWLAPPEEPQRDPREHDSSRQIGTPL
jgi:hypothetical protein